MGKRFLSCESSDNEDKEEYSSSQVNNSNKRVKYNNIEEAESEGEENGFQFINECYDKEEGEEVVLEAFSDCQEDQFTEVDDDQEEDEDEELQVTSDDLEEVAVLPKRGMIDDSDDEYPEEDPGEVLIGEFAEDTEDPEEVLMVQFVEDPEEDDLIEEEFTEDDLEEEHIEEDPEEEHIKEDPEELIEEEPEEKLIEEDPEEDPGEEFIEDNQGEDTVEEPARNI